MISTDKQEFNKQQYLTLRKEIEECKSKMFTLSIIGPAALPLAQGLVRFYQIDETIIGMPFLIIAIALLYASENYAMMRAGLYIKLNIETQIKNFTGWEKWLEEYKEVDTRKKERLAAQGYYLIMLSLYFCSAVVAVKFSYNKFSIYTWKALALFYFFMCCWFIYFLVKNYRECTKIALGHVMTYKGDNFSRRLGL